jgi:hypothetical protein
MPDVFLGRNFIHDPQQLEYVAVVFDFRYLKDPEPVEQRINNSTELCRFEENYMELLGKLYIT